MMDTSKPCVFCAPAIYIDNWEPLNEFYLGFNIYKAVPLGPVTPGHTLVIPLRHAPDALTDPRLTGAVMTAAARVAAQMSQEDDTLDFNIITSVGANATQTVKHLHVHIVPRRRNDGLHLPWTGQKK